MAGAAGAALCSMPRIVVGMMAGVEADTGSTCSQAVDCGVVSAEGLGSLGSEEAPKWNQNVW